MEQVQAAIVLNMKDALKPPTCCQCTKISALAKSRHTLVLKINFNGTTNKYSPSPDNKVCDHTNQKPSALIFNEGHPYG